MTFRIPAGFLALAALALAGCGDSNSISGPDTSPPQAPVLINGYSKEAGTIVLNWAPNTEGDLAGYNVYEGAGTTPIQQVAAGSRCTAVRALYSGSSPWHITAIDRSGNESAPSKTVAIGLAQTPTPEPDDFIDLRN